MSRLARSPDPAPKPLTVEQADGVTTVTLVRPRRRNCLSEDVIEALHATFTRLGEDADTRVIVLAAEGPAFSSGHDMKEMTVRRSDADGGRAYFSDLMQQCSRMMMSIVHCPKPVIARVQGIAAAAGCQLVASCDLAVASTHATFCTPGVHIGLFCSTPMVAISRNVSRKHAMEMLLEGEMISARRARRFGLVNKVVAADKLAAKTEKLARKIASKSSLTLTTGKTAFYRQAEMPLEEAYAYASRVMVENMLARDAEEGIGAFIEKRSPEWQDR